MAMIEFPVDWRDLKGFEKPFERMKVLRHANRLPPVLLLEGHEGIGKNRLAAAVAALYVCENLSACGECEACTEVRYDQHGDVFWMQPGDGRIKLDQAAELQAHLQYNPGESRNKQQSVRIAIGIDIDAMIPQAANRLLKTLEEPPPRARMILTTSRYGSLLETVRSRCVKWHLRLPNGLADSSVTQIDPDLKRALEEVIFAKDKAQAAIKSQDIIKDFRLTASECVKYVELVLNQYYRQRAQSSGNEDDCGGVATFRRRQQLQELHKLAIRQQVALNPQLSLESLAVFK